MCRNYSFLSIIGIALTIISHHTSCQQNLHVILNSQFFLPAIFRNHACTVCIDCGFIAYLTCIYFINVSILYFCYWFVFVFVLFFVFGCLFVFCCYSRCRCCCFINGCRHFLSHSSKYNIRELFFVNHIYQGKHSSLLYLPRQQSLLRCYHGNTWPSNRGLCGRFRSYGVI